MNQNSLIVLGCVAIGVLVFHHEKPKVPPVAAAQPQAASKFDYGDGVGATPNATTPIPAFGDNQKGMGSSPTPIITGTADVTNPGGKSAFSDVPPEKVESKPVAAVPNPEAVVVKSTPPSAFESVKPQESAFESAKSDIGNHVFPIRCFNGAGSAVAVASDTLVSAHHVALYAQAQISLSSGIVNATVQHPPGADNAWNDAAILKVSGGQFPPMKCRAAKYGEAVTVYGQATRTPMRGFVSSTRSVSLDPSSTGVKSGDSGGAVVADSDGCLVGIISVAEGKNQNYVGNDRVVMMTRIEYVLPYLPQGVKAPSAVPKPVGSVHPETSSAVNTNQSGFASPAAGWDAFNTPQQTQSQPQCATQGQCAVPQAGQQQQQFYYTVPNNGRGRVRWIWQQ